MAYVCIPDQNRQKLNAKCESYIFVGYSEKSKVYRLFNSITNKIIVLRDMIFDEGGVYGHQKGHVEKPKSVLDNIITNNDNEQLANGSISRSLSPPISRVNPS